MPTKFKLTGLAIACVVLGGIAEFYGVDTASAALLDLGKKVAGAVLLTLGGGIVGQEWRVGSTQRAVTAHADDQMGGR